MSERLILVIAYHSIFTVRGFWLPNDQRGSSSDYIRCLELFKFGPPTKTEERRSLAREKFDPDLRHRARQSLKYGAVHFNGIQARAVAQGFANACHKSGYRVLACAILPDHVHMVIARTSMRLIERIVGHLKARATQELIREGIHPFREKHDPKGRVPSCWVQHGWNVYLDSHADIQRAVEYVNSNPLRAGLKSQNWRFVGR